jgi:hypothetical protein
MGNDKYIKTYNEEGLRIDKIEFIWDFDTMDWVNDFKQVYIRDDDNLIIEVLGYNWDSILTDWIIHEKVTYSVIENGDRIELIYSWDTVLNTWQLREKQELFYDDSGNWLGHADYLWDIEFDVWVGINKLELMYDENENRIGSIYYLWDSVFNDWIANSKSEYYWSSMIVGINENPNAVSFSIYPNPSSGKVNLITENINSTLTVELLGVNGQLYYSQQLEVSNNYYTIDLPEVSKGIYLLKVQGKDFVKTEKLMIK